MYIFLAYQLSASKKLKTQCLYIHYNESLSLYFRSQKRNRDNNYNGRGNYTYRARSLPNMKLEPLLGNKAKYELTSANLADLKSLNGVKLKFLKSTKFLEELPPISDSITQERTVTKDTPVSLTQTNNDSEIDRYSPQSCTDTEDSESIKVIVNTSSNKSEPNPSSERSTRISSSTVSANEKSSKAHSKSSIRSLGIGRRNKRMKFKKSQLAAIEEDERELLLQRLSRSSTMNKLPLPLTYAPGTNVIDSSDSYLDIQQSLDERKRDVALLRKIHNSTNSQRISSQIAMQSLAKKKLRKLPPLPKAVD